MAIYGDQKQRFSQIIAARLYNIMLLFMLAGWSSLSSIKLCTLLWKLQFLIKDYIEQLKQTACFNIIKTGKELNIAVLNNIMYPWTPPIYIIMSLFIHWSPKGNKRTSRNQEIILCNILRHLKSQSIAALTKRD